MRKPLVMAAGAVMAGIGSVYLSWNEKRKFERDLQRAHKDYQKQAEEDLQVIQKEWKKEEK